MALPLPAKAALAQALWESIGTGLPHSEEATAVRDAVHRDNDISTGIKTGASHEEAMKAARHAIGSGDRQRRPSAH